VIRLQVVPRPGADAHKLLRSKVIHEARTWDFANKAKTRLKHKTIERGYIAVGKVDGVLLATIHPSSPEELFFLAEKFIGRLIAWFENDIHAINLQFVSEPPPKKRRKRR
jgi:hypothetical protein